MYEVRDDRVPGHHSHPVIHDNSILSGFAVALTFGLFVPRRVLRPGVLSALERDKFTRPL